MGASKKWLKTIVSKKLSPQSKNADTEPSPHKKPSRWNLLKSCRVIDKGSTLGGEEDEDEDEENGGSVSGASVKASQIVLSQADREEQAAICIQTAFRGFLARRALCALKGLMRLQAAINGHSMQKQSIGSLRSIQTFVRMQARIRTHRASKNKGAQGVLPKVSSHAAESRPAENEDGWCDTMGTVEEIQARVQQRQEAAVKRERAMAYAFSNQWRANSKLNLESLFDYELDNSTWSWIWLDRWISSQPGEGHPTNLMSKPDNQAVEDTTKTTDLMLKKSASLTMNKSANLKHSLDTSKGNQSELARARSHGAGSGLLGNKSNGKKKAQTANAEQSSRQHDWRSLSNPKQRPNKDVKKRYSLPNAVRKPQVRQAAANEQATNGVVVLEEEKKVDIVQV
eukprot:c9741_g1_i1 orf=238-1431(+)